MPSVFFDPPERTEFSDDYYSLVGRLLSVVQTFEGKAKALALLINVKSNPSLIMDKGKDYNRLIHKLYEKPHLARTLKSIASTLGFTDAGKDVLEKARAQRNHVAHELGIVIDENDEEGLSYLTEKAAEIVEDIVAGEMLISAAIAILEGSPLPTVEGSDRIKKRVVDWVCELGDH